MFSCAIYTCILSILVCPLWPFLIYFKVLLVYKAFNGLGLSYIGKSLVHCLPERKSEMQPLSITPQSIFVSLSSSSVSVSSVSAAVFSSIVQHKTGIIVTVPDHSGKVQEGYFKLYP